MNKSETSGSDSPDKYGNTEYNFQYCCFPDCGCDGARLCDAPSGPNYAALNLNIEKGSLSRLNRKPE